MNAMDGQELDEDHPNNCLNIPRQLRMVKAPSRQRPTWIRNHRMHNLYGPSKVKARSEELNGGEPYLQFVTCIRSLDSSLIIRIAFWPSTYLVPLDVLSDCSRHQNVRARQPPARWPRSPASTKKPVFCPDRSCSLSEATRG